MRMRPGFSLCLLTAVILKAGEPSSVSSYQPPTAEQRLKWYADATAGPVTILGGLFSSGLLTLRDRPPEYGPHWEGYAKRNGLRLAGNSVSNAIEGSLGAVLGEDPRYVRVPEKPFGARLANAMRMIVMTHDRNGREVPNYSRLIAAPSASAISNAWRPDSQVSVSATFSRVGFSFMGQAIANTFVEFWPDLRKRLGRRSGTDDDLPSPDPNSVR